jgi:hypothetical protein
MVHIQFNLGDLQKGNNYDLDVPEEYKALTPDPLKTYKIAFNFCTKAQKPLVGCASSNYSMAYLYTEDDEAKPEADLEKDDLDKCMPLTDENTSWKYVEAKKDSTNKRILAFVQKYVDRVKNRVYGRVLEDEDDSEVLGIRGIASNSDEGLYNFEYEILCPTDDNPEKDFTMKILADTEFKRLNQK